MQRDLIYTYGKMKWNMSRLDSASVTIYTACYNYHDLILRFTITFIVIICVITAETLPLEIRLITRVDNSDKTAVIWIEVRCTIHTIYIKQYVETRKKNSMDTNCCLFESVVPSQSHHSFGYHSC